MKNVFLRWAVDVGIVQNSVERSNNYANDKNNVCLNLEAVMANLLKTTTSKDMPLDGSSGDDTTHTVSEFLTIQSLTNFAAMSGAIFAAWSALQRLFPGASDIWIPYVFAVCWGVVSLFISRNGLKKDGSGQYDIGNVLGAVFIAVINSLVLANAVIGISGISVPTH